MKSYPTESLPLVLDPVPLSTARTRDAILTSAEIHAGTREEILRRAYTIWENEGHPEHREMENWLQAETDICGKEKWGRV